MNAKHTSDIAAWNDTILSFDRMQKSVRQLNQLYTEERRYAGTGETKFRAMLKDLQGDPASAFLQDTDPTPHET